MHDQALDEPAGPAGDAPFHAPCHLQAVHWILPSMATLSGRSCSAACADFFERNAVPLEEAPERANAKRNPFLGEPGLKFGKRHVRPLLERGSQSCGRLA